MRHLESRPLEAALDIEALVGLAAVKDGLVAANLGGNKVKGLDQPQAQLLPLLVLCNRDIFDVSDRAETVDTNSRTCVSTLNKTTTGRSREPIACLQSARLP